MTRIMNPVEIQHGDSPVVLGLPHTGTYIPDVIKADLNHRGLALDDTDWHIERLYDGLLKGVTTVRANFHRYVIDANRDPSGASLYPGQNTTGLVPLTDFDANNIWDNPPSIAEIEARRVAFHRPYHAALKQELQRIYAIHGMAILYDCHSIRSHIPFLFEGTLPDFNIGTNNGATCDMRIANAVDEICKNAAQYTSVINGRFKGGWTTRHYGQPQSNIHAIQMELAQSTYLSAQCAPWSYDETKAAKLRSHLQNILKTLTDLAQTMKG